MKRTRALVISSSVDDDLRACASSGSAMVSERKRNEMNRSSCERASVCVAGKRRVCVCVCVGIGKESSTVECSDREEGELGERGSRRERDDCAREMR